MTKLYTIYVRDAQLEFYVQFIIRVTRIYTSSNGI